MVRVVRAVFDGVLVLFAVVTGLTLLLAARFPAFELLSNFLPQAFVLLVLFLPLVILGRWWGETTVIVVMGLVVGAAVVPYLRVNETVATDESASFLQYNVLFTNRNFDGIERVVRNADADVVALHELTEVQWAELEPRLADLYPHSVVLLVDPSRSRGGGKALLSKSPLTEVPFDLPDDVTLPLAATTVVDNREVLAIALHPSPSRTGARRIYHRQIKLRAVVDMVSAYDGPAVVITDLNIAPTSPHYQTFLDELGWADPRRRLGIEATYDVRGRRPLGVAIDHVFVSPEMRVDRFDVGYRGGSDHRSLVATVSWADLVKA